jgi:hypothetical protein
MMPTLLVCKSESYFPWRLPVENHLDRLGRWQFSRKAYEKALAVEQDHVLRWRLVEGARAGRRHDEQSCGSTHIDVLTIR